MLNIIKVVSDVLCTFVNNIRCEHARLKDLARVQEDIERATLEGDAVSVERLKRMEYFLENI